jgi:hypothetical protein
MNENEFDQAARAWLEHGPNRMSDRALLSALEQIHSTRQRRATWPVWRAPGARISVRVAIAAVLVAVGLVAVNVLPHQPNRSTVGGSPTPSVSSSPAQLLDFPNLATTFVSPRNGFSIKHPDRAVITPASDLWDPSNEETDRGVDVVETGLAAVLKGASTPTYFSPDGCGVPLIEQAEVTIDGQSSRIAECANRIEATVVFGGRLYLFTLLHDRTDARAVFDAFAATIDLTPETAIDFPPLATTFVSPTNGFSFGYLDRGGLQPATKLWEPLTQPATDSSGRYDGPFDVVETGLGAFFKGASTAIPDGVSIDPWVDQYVLPRGCGGPRSQQPEITIDGQSGRIAECPNEIEATVVAGGRLYLFTLLHSRPDARAFFDAWIATIDLRPEEAAVPSSNP